MIYKLESGNGSKPILSWVYIFGILSLEHCSWVYADLNFPFSPTNDLREISQEFVVAYHTVLGNPILDSVSTDFTTSISLKIPLQERYKILFENTFSRLDKMGYAETVYRWGKHTSDFCKYENVKSLRAWCRLLYQWAIANQINQPINYPSTFYSPDWAIVLAKWSDIWGKMSFEDLPLNNESRLAVQSTSLNYQAMYLRFETAWENFGDLPKSKWDDFVLRSTGTFIWTLNEGRFQSDLMLWKTILNSLSSYEIQGLEQWSLLHENRSNERKIPSPRLVDFNY